MSTHLEFQKYKVLFAPEIKHSKDSLGRLWMESVLQSLVSSGAEVTFVYRDLDDEFLSAATVESLRNVYPPTQFGEESLDDSGVIPRFRARQIVRLMDKEDFDVVLVQGLELSKFVAGSGRGIHNIWAFPEDNPARPRVYRPDELKIVEAVATGSKLVLTSTSVIRGQVDNSCPSATSKTRLFPELQANNYFSVSQLTSPQWGDETYAIDSLNTSVVNSFVDFSQLADDTSSLKEPPHFNLIGTEESIAALRSDSALHRIPGLQVKPNGFSPLDQKSATNIYLHFSDSKEISDEDRILLRLIKTVGYEIAVVPCNPKLNDLSKLEYWRESNITEGNFFSTFSSDLPDYESNPLADHPQNLLFVGADFKFAGDLVDMAVQRADLNVRADILKSNGKVDPAQSKPLLNWADVIIVEFASVNAVWYSNNVRSNQKLLVHLHGYELYSDWISELNVDRVSAVVVASDFYRSQVIEKMGWASSKVIAIPNSVRTVDLQREKYPEARFHLGLVGIVPILKRPDRAIKLLRRLVEIDPRYTLHIRGHFPWNYPWEWEKSAHQDAYRAFYKEIAREPNLLHNISFEPFGPDIGNWLTKIGWILSPSYRETFHLAAIEGACSGAIPLAWNRAGSMEIIGPEYNVDDTDEAFNRIIEINRSENVYRENSHKASESVRKYSSEVVRKNWIDLIFSSSLSQSTSELDSVTNSLAADEKELFEKVLVELEHRDLEGALSVVNEGIQVTVGKHGPLKELELYIRGVAAIDDRRFHILHHYKSNSSHSALEKPLFVHPQNSEPDELISAGFSRNSVSISEPLSFLHGSSIDPLFIPAVEELSPKGEYRFDRWIEFTKASIIREFLDEGSQSILASGPWWCALACALAANQLNIPFSWYIDDSANLDFSRIEALTPGSPDLESQIERRILQFADYVIQKDGRRKLSTRSVIEVGKQQVQGQGSVGAESMLKLRSKGINAPETIGLGQPESYDILSRPAHDFTVAFVGDSSRQEKTCFKEFKVLNCGESRDKWFLEGCDILMIHSDSLGGDQDYQWATALIRDARIKGIRSSLIYTSSETMPTQLLEVARICDSVAAVRLPAIAALLQLNPLQVIYVSTWSHHLSFEQNLILSMRSTGLPVDGSIIATMSEPTTSIEVEVGKENERTTDPVPSLGLISEGISVVIATHNGEKRIRNVLDDIANQTLLPKLIEVIIIENGGKDSTSSIIKAFSSEHPNLNLTYSYEDLASAGNARNIGIEKAQGRYVTFVDDDDRLEPNYLLSMWLSAGSSSVVVGGLSDMTPDGIIKKDTPNNARLEALRDTRVPLYMRSGLLFMNSCKLIPRDRLIGIRYETDLKSGEDVVFMSSLLQHEDLTFVPAADYSNADYIRVLRDNSVSRQSATFDFAIKQRVAVLNALSRLRDRLPQSAARPIEVTQHAQASFIRKYRDDNPESASLIEEYLHNHLLPVSDFVKLR